MMPGEVSWMHQSCQIDVLPDWHYLGPPEVRTVLPWTSFCRSLLQGKYSLLWTSKCMCSLLGSHPCLQHSKVMPSFVLRQSRHYGYECDKWISYSHLRPPLTLVWKSPCIIWLCKYRISQKFHCLSTMHKNQVFFFSCSYDCQFHSRKLWVPQFSIKH